MKRTYKQLLASRMYGGYTTKSFMLNPTFIYIFLSFLISFYKSHYGVTSRVFFNIHSTIKNKGLKYLFRGQKYFYLNHIQNIGSLPSNFEKFIG